MKKIVFLIGTFLFGTGNFFSQVTIVLPVSKDAAIGFHDGVSTAANNYGAAIQNAGFWVPSAAAPPPGANGNRALIDFNLAAIPVGATITAAFLNLYATGPLGSVQGHFGANASVLERITQNWQEFSATWNNQPASTSQNSVLLPQSTSATQNYLNINVLNLVQDMLANPSAGFGFKLKLVNESLNRGLIFCSKDHSDEARRPTLEVTYITCSQNFQVSPASLTICSGNSASFSTTGSGLNNINWFSASSPSTPIYTGATFLTPVLTAQSAPVLYTFYASGSCSQISPLPLNITVNPTPNVWVTGLKEVICAGQSTTLTASGASSYTWTQGFALTSLSAFMIISPGSSSSYAVTGINTFGCLKTYNYTQLVMPCTGMAENTMEKHVTFFPNPASTEVSVSCSSGGYKPTALLIKNLSGQTLNVYQMRDEIQIVDISNFSNGFYFCEVVCENNIHFTGKFIVRH